MAQEPRIQRVTPEELPKVLSQLDVEKTTRLALIGPSVRIESEPQRFVFQLTDRLSEMPHELLQFEQLQTLILMSVEVRDNDVLVLAEHLGQLTWLDLSFNQISDDGARAIARHLGKLTSLNLSNNQIGDAGAQAIAEHLGQLTWLCLRYTQIGDAAVQAIAEHLGKLTSLDLTGNKIGDAGAQAIAEHLGQLTSLGLGGSQISDAGAQVIAEHLGQLTSLSLSQNQISDAGAQAIAEHLGQLIWLDLSFNQISDDGAQIIAKHLGQLATLNLSFNLISDDGAQVIAEQLHKLTSLGLSYNPIGDAGAQAIAEHLDQLTLLNLAYNKVTDLSPLKSLILSGLPVKWSDHWEEGSGIYVQDCPLSIPPVEIAQQGSEAVLNYFREIEEQGKDRLFEAKLLIVGEGGAGKTSLLRRMFMPEKELPEEDQTTRGIDIYRHEFPVDDGRTFRLNAWDFGGQQIYHATHQFFLTKRSLYVLVDDTRTDSKSIHDESFKFWLEVVETLSEACPLLIFQNEKGGRSKQIDEAGIKGRFPNVKEFYRGNLEQPDAADDIRKAVEYFARNLPHIGEDVPAKWVPIRIELEELAQSRPYISLDDYFEVYGHHLQLDRDKALHLSQYLHDLGVFLHFQQTRELRRTVFLQNRWVTEAVFRILDDEAIKSRRGRFTLADCDRLWADKGYADKEIELRALMVRFELAYKLPDTSDDAWLVPQHLSPSRPPELADWSNPGDLVLTYRYEFLPRGLVSRLIVRMHRFVKQPDLCWSYGALFEHDGTQVLVETATRGNEIALRSRGPEQKALLSVIASDLDALNDSFEGLKTKVSKWVPCICKTCRGLEEPAKFDQKELIERKHRGKRTIECPKPPDYADVNVLELLDGISIDQLPEWAREPEANGKRFAIAVSFAGENREFVLSVVESLQKAFGKDRVFYDEWHEVKLLGSGGDLKLQECYNQAELVIPFFSKYYAKPWCAIEWETIRGILLNRPKDDAVIPVHLDDTKIPGWSDVNFGIKPKGRSAKEIAKLILDAYRIRQ